MRYFYLVFFIAWQSNICIAQIDWEKDIEFLRTELPSKHINLFAVRTKVDWDTGLDQIKSDLRNLNDLGVCIKLSQHLATFGDSHSGISLGLANNAGSLLPFKVYWFKEGVTITRTSPLNKQLLGKQLLGINGYEINEIIKKISSIVTVDNNSALRNLIPEYIIQKEILFYFGYLHPDSAVSVEVADGNNKKVSVQLVNEEINDSNMIKYNRSGELLYLKYQDKIFAEEYSSDDSVYNVFYNKCTSKEVEEKYYKKENSSLPSFEDFKDRIFKTVKEKPLKKFIFDMRFNSGGSSPQGTQFIKEISKIKKLNKSGVLYVLIGRRTFSSAILNTMDFKKYTKAKFVGEETGGKPNHFGEVRSFILPESKTKVYYSTKYFWRQSFNYNTFIPDVKVEQSFNDALNGKDSAIDYILIQQ